ncbi:MULTISPECIES: helix-turn-helix domain-containing protein [Aliagarivorans]|uniref:helix-turn-helix domain-containing protein n=1 Tax=Aliagarivorans TaxID=882379 RepID=UPI000479903E|nr:MULTISPECIES: helix-turn-helix transcriptional regulator [Aliagarivorans]
MHLKSALSEKVCEFLKENKLTQVEAAKELGVSQSTISRVRQKNWKTRGRQVEKLIKIFDLDYYLKPDPAKSKVLMSALSDVWDGSDAHAKALSKALRSLVDLAKTTRQ